MYSLRLTIPAVTGAVAIAAAGLVAVLFDAQARDTALANANAMVQERSATYAHSYERQYRQIAKDVTLLGSAPSVRAVVGLSALPGGQPAAPSDATTNATTADGGTPPAIPDVSKRASAALFTTLLQTNPDYTQARIISASGSGRELVRVDRLANGAISVVPEMALQEKAAEPYFRLAKQHDWSRGANPGEANRNTLFSEVSFNRELGKVSYPAVYTQRAIYPLLDKSGVLLGIVVLNFNYNSVIASVFGKLGGSSRAILVNDQGDYLALEGSKGLTDFQISGDYTHAVPPLVSAMLNARAPAGQFGSTNAIGYFHSVQLSPAQPDKLVRIGFVESLPELLSFIEKPSWESWIAVALILSVALAAAVILTHIVMKPLRVLGREVDGAISGESELHLPSDWRHELGRLAKAFQSLYDGHVDAERRLELILDRVGEGIITIDGEGSIVTFNAACEQMFGFAQGEVLGRNIRMLMPLKQGRSHDKYLSRYIESGERRIDWAGRQEFGRRKDGSRFPIELTVTEIEIEDQLHFVGILRDVSERAKFEQVKSDFLSLVSHELRTPLTSIQGALNLLASPAIRDDGTRHDRCVTIAIDNCNRLRRLIVNMTEMMEFEKNIHRINRKPCELESVVSATQGYRDELEAQSGIRIHVVTEHDGLVVFGDKERLTLVLENLLSNAIKFSPRGSEVVVRLGLDAEGVSGMISVEDQGAGIPEAKRDKIWASFTQADSGSNRSAEGAGLGLAVASFIMRLHDGKLVYMPGAERGSIFSFQVPLAASMQRAVP